MHNANLPQKIAQHYNWYLFQSVLLIVFGLISIFLPRITALSLELLIGCLLFVSGLFSIIANIKSKTPVSTYIPAILFVLAGVFMLLHPLLGLYLLSILITIFLFCKGLSDIYFAYQYKPMANWQWLLISGIITLMLAFIAWYGFPQIGILYLGVIIGINMFMYGIALLVLTWGVKQDAQQ